MLPARPLRFLEGMSGLAFAEFVPRLASPTAWESSRLDARNHRHPPQPSCYVPLEGINIEPEVTVGRLQKETPFASNTGFNRML